MHQGVLKSAKMRKIPPADTFLCIFLMLKHADDQGLGVKPVFPSFSPLLLYRVQKRSKLTPKADVPQNERPYLPSLSTAACLHNKVLSLSF